MESLKLVTLFLSAFIGFGIGFSIFWCISATSPTTTSMVGAANKIPLSILGVIVFSEPLTSNRAMFICIGSIAGVTYAKAKANLAISLRKNDGDKKGKMNEKVDGFAAEAAQPAIQLIQVTSNDRSSS